MTSQEKQYYKEMLQRNRLFPFYYGDKFVGFITFYICSSVEQIRDSWEIREDDLQGELCVIQQLLTTKQKINSKISHSIWNGFKDYIRENFPQAQYIYWKRYKQGKIKVYIKSLREGINARFV